MCRAARTIALNADVLHGPVAFGGNISSFSMSNPPPYSATLRGMEILEDLIVAVLFAVGADGTATFAMWVWNQI